MTSTTVRAIAILGTGLLVGCGGGGGGGGGATDSTGGNTGMTMGGTGGTTGTGGMGGSGGTDGGGSTGAGSEGATMPVNMLSAPGLYLADPPIRAEDDFGAVTTVLITPDDRALIRVEGITDPANTADFFKIVDTALMPATDNERSRIIRSVTASMPNIAATYSAPDPGALVKSFSNTGVYRVKPFITPDMFPASFGGFDFPSSPTIKPLMLLPVSDQLTYLLKPAPKDYNTPSSLDRIANTYTKGTFSLTVDSAGQVAGLDSTTNCAFTGKVSVDMPLVNAYSLELNVTMCADVPQNVIQNGTYTGRASVLDSPNNMRSILIFAHSSTIALNVPVLTTATLPTT